MILNSRERSKKNILGLHISVYYSFSGGTIQGLEHLVKDALGHNVDGRNSVVLD
jgi:hypothetical protein